MKRICRNAVYGYGLVVCACLCLSLYGCCTASNDVGGTGPDRQSVYFSPRGGCQEAIISKLNDAKSEVLVQAYYFTSVPIAEAMVAAKARGVDCRVILDKSQHKLKYDAAQLLDKAGILILIDHQPAIAHNKVMIVDRKTVITGSFNFTTSAESRNAENLVILTSPDIVQTYLNNWHKRAKLSCTPKEYVSMRKENIRAQKER